MGSERRNGHRVACVVFTSSLILLLAIPAFARSATQIGHALLRARTAQPEISSHASSSSANQAIAGSAGPAQSVNWPSRARNSAASHVEAQEEEDGEPRSDIDPATIRQMKSHAFVAPGRSTGIPAGTVFSATEDKATGATQTNGPVTPLAPNLLLNFAGVSDLDQLDGYIHKPPDTNLAAGPSHIMLVVNSLIATYSKNGTLLSTASQLDWFSNVCAGCIGYDPRVTYDPVAGHWIMLFLYKDSTSVSKVLLSVSQTSDPTGAWWNWSLEGALTYSGENTWADYPDVGFDGIASGNGGAVYVTVNQFTFSSGAFRTSTLYILPKSSLYSGGGLNFWRAFNRTNGDGTQAFTLRASKTYGNPGGEFLVNTENNGSTVSLWRVNPTYPPTAVDWTLQSTQAIGGYTIPPDATQPGTSDLIATIDNRLYNAVWQDSRVFTAFTTAYNWGSGTVSAVQSLKINTSSNTTEINNVFGADGLYYYSPAIATDNADNIVFVFSRSGPSEYAGARYTGRLTSDSGTQGSASLKGGTTTLFEPSGASSNRWGDYQGVAMDPSDGSKVWIAGEWATDLGLSNDYNWSTWTGQVQFTASTLNPPTGVLATATSTTTVSITWSAPGGSPPARYHVYRSSNGVSYGQVNGEATTGTSYSDSSASGSVAYLYKVRSVDGSGNESSDSNFDLATTVVFTDPTLSAQSTVIKAVHILELRTAVNAVRALAGLSAYGFSDSTITTGSTRVRKIHVTDLRSALDPARANLGLSALTYTDSVIIAQSTRVQAVHITELRNGVK
jgi:hypothetical protein